MNRIRKIVRMHRDGEIPFLAGFGALVSGFLSVLVGIVVCLALMVLEGALQQLAQLLGVTELAWAAFIYWIQLFIVAGWMFPFVLGAWSSKAAREVEGLWEGVGNWGTVWRGSLDGYLLGLMLWLFLSDHPDQTALLRSTYGDALRIWSFLLIAAGWIAAWVVNRQRKKQFAAAGQGDGLPS